MILGGGTHRRYKKVAPFGGRRGVCDTNPSALTLPAGRFGRYWQTSPHPQPPRARCWVHRSAREPVPEGWIIDAQGNPTTDAEDF